MSVCFNINCHDCQESLWVAQEGLSGSTFYRGDKDTMKSLGEFFFEHRGHALSFDGEDKFEHYKEKT